jgi:hypothetical protein
MYIYNTRFRVFIDSRAAKALLEANDAKAGGRLLRWRFALAEFDFDVLHRSGVQNGNADALSRFHLKRSDPYGEEPTEIFPSTSLNNVEDIDIVAVPLPPGQADAPVPIIRPSFFGDADLDAWTIADWIPVQNDDDFSNSIRAKIGNGNPRISRRFRIDPDGLLYRSLSSLTAETT